jgi:hypothetical protein
VCERACASARVVKRSLIFGQNLSKLSENILQITTSCMGYVFVIFTGLNAHVVKSSLIFIPILSKCGKNMVRGTIIYMGYVLTLLTCRARVFECVHVYHGQMYTFAHIWTDSLQKWWNHIKDPQKLSGLFNLCMNECANSAHPYTFAHRLHVINTCCQARDGQGLVLSKYVIMSEYVSMNYTIEPLDSLHTELRTDTLDTGYIYITVEIQ